MATAAEDRRSLETVAQELKTQNIHLAAANSLIMRLGTQLDLPSLATALAASLLMYGEAERAIVLVSDEDSGLLKYAGSAGAEMARLRERLYVPYSPSSRDPIMEAWVNGQGVYIDPAELPSFSPVTMVAGSIGKPFFSIPLVLGDQFQGVAFVYQESGTPLLVEAQDMLMAIASTAAMLLKNARQHSRIVAELASKMHELHMLRRIDRELMDTIELEPVFSLTLDWALRFTNAHAASLALYDEELDTLYGFVDYGYEMPPEQMYMLRTSYGGGIALRVARSGRAEIVPDVSYDNQYIVFSSAVRSHLSLPVMREDRVVAVITIESNRLNAFTDDHLEFVEKLASRAGVAIDNARLYTETKREREKLSRILRNIADVVIVVGGDDRLALINPSALAVFELPPDGQYVGESLAEVFAAHPDFLRIFQRANNARGAGVEELRVGDGRTFYVNLSLHESIGWIIVMHDITPLKQIDQLKTELVQTVSHDLKQPLGVMNGYVELLMLQEKLDTAGENYARMIMRSINAMRQLIDDLLDLAKIESGVRLDMKLVSLPDVIAESVENLQLMADNKKTQVSNEIPADMPLMMGDQARLAQIFSNLIGNAIKYSPPGSTVQVFAEMTDSIVRVGVRDNGIGIAPEDQARIFDRFYRVRRAETRDIEGTGLGLAIVKRLVEAHNGQIGIDSRVGEGSTFFVTLPLR